MNRCRHERYAVIYGYRSVLIQFLIPLVPERTRYKPEEKFGTDKYRVPARTKIIPVVVSRQYYRMTFLTQTRQILGDRIVLSQSDSAKLFLVDDYDQPACKDEVELYLSIYCRNFEMLNIWHKQIFCKLMVEISKLS